MKSLYKRSALASALLLTALGAQAASMDFETSDSDTIVVGATAEKVTLRVIGFKNLSPSDGVREGTKLASFYMSTSSGMGEIAVTYGPEHSPTVSNNLLLGTITNEDGESVKTTIGTSRSGAGGGYYTAKVDGTAWGIVQSSREFDGAIYTQGANKLPAGVYPITLRAALYQP